jgi:hypothetical protein
MLREEQARERVLDEPIKEFVRIADVAEEIAKLKELQGPATIQPLGDSNYSPWCARLLVVVLSEAVGLDGF